MRRMKGAAGLLTALLLAFQLSAQTFALASEDNGIKVVPVNFTHTGYSYEIELSLIHISAPTRKY